MRRLFVELIGKLIRAWDPDYTKMTDGERRRIMESMNDELISDADIDWDNVDDAV